MRSVALFAAFVATVAPVLSADPDFEKDVRPILAKSCFACHGPTEQKGGLRFDRKADAFKGGDSGPPIVPGKPAESLLLKKVTSKDDDERMPPTGKPLPADQIRTLTQWIEAGAKWTENITPSSTHWSFQPIARPKIPTTNNSQSTTNPIDAFIHAKLNAVGLKPNGEADRRTLIRRLKFDLLGLPPTPEEVDAFVADKSPDAYEKLVEKYLASPHYGERWARHWLDVVRFAESNGFETNQPRSNAWPYRDWVIISLNDDKPYDRFVREQLAGDTLGVDAATGFLVAGPWDEVKSPDITLTLQQRADELHDMLSTTGSTFLGLTVGCARCHGHKFDPVSQLDYYRLKAIFAGVQHGDRLTRNGDQLALAKETGRLRADLITLEAKLVAMEPLADPAATEPRRLPVNSRLNGERFKPVEAKYIRFVIFETNSSEPCIDELEVFSAGSERKNVALASLGAKVRSSGDYSASPSIHRLEFINDGKYGNGRSWISNQVGRGRIEIELAEVTTIDRIVWARDRDGGFSDRLAIRYRIDVSTDRDSWVVVASSDDRLPFGSTTGSPSGLTVPDRNNLRKLAKEIGDLRARLMSLERGQMVYAGRMTTPEPTFRLHRGDPIDKREPVGPGVLSEIGPKLTIPENASDADRRSALAKWITDPTNPLTARVIVNRLWHYHFGTGIVDTPSDFGSNGGKPMHPELLDWLAAELMQPQHTDTQSGVPVPWSLKHIHRLIVTSATYRQSSVANEAGRTKDAQARLLWRYTPRRIEAEPLRDAILFVSGKLDLRMGGPGFDLFESNSNYVKVYTPKKEFGPTEFRRMVYQMKPRMQLDDTFGVFDCPDAGQIAPKRNISTTPLQSLNLLNSTFVLQQAGFLTERIEKEAGPNSVAQVKQAFRLTVQRFPTEKELSAAEKLVRDHGLIALCRALLNANEFVFVD
ncbi:MAG TPA: PSD1 and planctomycete cytochrome C domain-containing protein [Gemmata sp.]|jgi:cytochrome c553|nr:PSD1 and planctomycete cytochrome C domain-containing protein [Gemmata sp.]